MDFRQQVRIRIAGLALRPERDTEIVEELAQHLDDAVNERRAAGESLAQAQAAALADLDAPGELERRLAPLEQRPRLVLPPPGAPSRGRWLAAGVTDLRHALRSLRRAPGFSAAVITTLALTIGPATAILSIGNWMFWRPTPGVADAGRLAVVWLGQWRDNGVTISSLSYANLEALHPRLRSFAGFAGVQEGSTSVAVGRLAPVVSGVAAVTGNAFDVLGLRITAGRPIRADDDRMPQGAQVAVLSESLARRAFGDLTAALGKPIALNGRSLEIVGVVDAFRGTQPFTAIDVWYPGATYAYINHLAKPMTRDSAPILYYVARLAPGATFESAQAELDVVVPTLAESDSTGDAKFETVRARLFPGLGPMALQRAGYARLLRDLLLVCGVLLVLGCANVSNLLVAHGLRTRRNRMVRLALGASRARLWQLQLAEGAVLALAGGLAGLAIAQWLKQLVVALMVPGLTAGATPDVPLDWRVLAMTTGVALACGLIATILPAIVAARAAATTIVAGDGSRSVTGARRLRTALAVVQLALSLALVTNAAMLVVSLRHLYSVDLGFDPGGVSVHAFDPARHGYTPELIRVYYDGLMDRLGQAAPGEVALSFRAPFGSGRTMRVQPPDAASTPVEVYANAVSSAYFDVLGIPVRRGRTFTPEEVASRADVAVISARLASRLFGEVDPVGQPVTLPGGGSSPGRPLRVVGVAGDTQWRGITDDPELFLYLPFGDRSIGIREATLLVRSDRPMRDVTARVSAVAAELDPSLPVQFSRPLADGIDRALSDQRVFAWMFSLLGILGFALAAVGLCGLLAQGVGERTREFGVRRALGSTRGAIFALVLRHAGWIGAAGTMLGLAGAYLGSHLIESQLFGITRVEPLVYAAAAGALAITVLAATIWPARAATRIQPTEALRAD